MSTLRRFELLLAFLSACAVVAPTARADEDALAPYRDRFRQGMEKYKVGAMAEAIRVWTAIYEEIGPQRGYRLSFNLARAYEANFETSRAAERYQSFLDDVAVRRAAGQALDPIVEREASEAQSRLAELDANNGRIRIVSGGRPVAAQIDTSDPRLGTFVTYVAPGDHVVIFSPGSTEQERREVSVKAGELILVSPTPPPEPLPNPELRVPAPPKSEVAPVHRTETQHPISPVVLYVSAGATVLSVVAPIVAYAHAHSLWNTYNQTVSGGMQDIQTEYAAERSTAYATLAIPLALTAVTGALIVYYFGGTSRREVTLGVRSGPGGGAAIFTGSF